jgi:hypothetical protein
MRSPCDEGFTCPTSVAQVPGLTPVSTTLAILVVEHYGASRQGNYVFQQCSPDVWVSRRSTTLAAFLGNHAEPLRRGIYVCSQTNAGIAGPSGGSAQAVKSRRTYV